MPFVLKLNDFGHIIRFINNQTFRYKPTVHKNSMIYKLGLLKSIA